MFYYGPEIVADRHELVNIMVRSYPPQPPDSTVDPSTGMLRHLVSYLVKRYGVQGTTTPRNHR